MTTIAPQLLANVTEAAVASQTFLQKLFVDVEEIPNNGYGVFQLLFLFIAYGYILMQGANLIKDGSELLLLIPSWAGIVGPVVLPVLGAVPDGAIVLFSGIGPDAQEQLSIGIGALAGSTIMLLTIPWFLSVVAGRVNVVDGQLTYTRPRQVPASAFNKLDPPEAIVGTGVGVGFSVQRSAVVMAITAIPYLVIQIPAIALQCSLKSQEGSSCNSPRPAALVAGIMAIILFIAYLADQKRQADKAEDVVTQAKMERVRHQAVDAKLINVAGLFADILKTTGDGGNNPASVTHALELSDAEFRKFLRPYFKRFDHDGSGAIDSKEVTDLLKALGENSSPEAAKEIIKEFDSDKDGTISFDEFVHAMRSMFVKEHRGGDGPRGDTPMIVSPVAAEPAHLVHVQSSETPAPPRADQAEQLESAEQLQTSTQQDNDILSTQSNGKMSGNGDAAGTEGAHDNHSAAEEEEGEDDDDDDSDEEIPDDLIGLSPEEQQSRILRRAFFLMSVGTIIVVVFSDAMVDVMGRIGYMTTIPPFYVSFVLAPLVSNGSEVIAAYFFAGKKTEKSMTIALSTLVGSAAINNTFCLAIFLFLVYGQSLEWVFTAEITAIIAVEIAMLAMVFLSGKMLKTWTAFVALALFPLSIALVAALENGAGLD